MHIIPAQESDLPRYIDMLEEIAEWLEGRGIQQWQPGNFRAAADYYAASIRKREVFMAFIGEELAGSLRVLEQDPIAWPDELANDAIYLYSVAVRRTCNGKGLGGQMLEWAAAHATNLGKRYVRLDCFASNPYLAGYYLRAGFEERGEIDARFPSPVGTLRLKRYQRRVPSRG
jgi:ribosomal protein S18 acetylase RimI-like enzyme